MRKEIESSLQWDDEFNEILRHVADARNIFENRNTSKSSDSLATIYERIIEIDQICVNLKYYFCRNSIDKLHRGQEMSKEELYLLAAQGLWVIPSESRSQEAYEEFAYYLYEDDDRKGYINSAQRPDPPPVPKGMLYSGFNVGVTPEDVRIGFLQPKQKDFFEKYKPDLFARFRRD